MVGNVLVGALCRERRATINLLDSRNLQPKNTSPVLPVRIVYLPLYGTERRQPAYGQRASRLTSKLWYICSSCHIFQSLPLFYFTFFSFSSLYNFRFINFSFRRFRLSNKRRIKIHFFENRSTYISVVYEFVFIFLKKKKEKETDNTFGSLKREFAGKCWTSNRSKSCL